MASARLESIDPWARLDVRVDESTMDPWSRIDAECSTVTKAKKVSPTQFSILNEHDNSDVERCSTSSTTRPNSPLTSAQMLSSTSCPQSRRHSPSEGLQADDASVDQAEPPSMFDSMKAGAIALLERDSWLPSAWDSSTGRQEEKHEASDSWIPSLWTNEKDDTSFGEWQPSEWRASQAAIDRQFLKALSKTARQDSQGYSSSGDFSAMYVPRRSESFATDYSSGGESVSTQRRREHILRLVGKPKYREQKIIEDVASVPAEAPASKQNQFDVVDHMMKDGLVDVAPPAECGPKANALMDRIRRAHNSALDTSRTHQATHFLSEGHGGANQLDIPTEASNYIKMCAAKEGLSDASTADLSDIAGPRVVHGGPLPASSTSGRSLVQQQDVPCFGHSA